ncbi:hypothetical protein PIB30_083158 [Stylosanthes scabra]|uniref:Uncharacterized protein n=1 Tax=Stylosanthes scabra TaxID=79078 RepID=A0ABU6QSQ8_9FABA|nr:hypothetical protein [Stylosanthes scabra]
MSRKPTSVASLGWFTWLVEEIEQLTGEDEVIMERREESTILERTKSSSQPRTREISFHGGGLLFGQQGEMAGVVPEKALRYSNNGERERRGGDSG